MRRLLAFILVLILTPLQALAQPVENENARLMRVKKGTLAYLEPVKDTNYLAGEFAYSSIVSVEDELTEDLIHSRWSKISYNYSEDQEEKDLRSVYVKSTDLVEIKTINDQSIENNKIISSPDINNAFDKELLVDHFYIPSENRYANVNISFTSNVNRSGKDANSSDSLLNVLNDKNKVDSQVYTPYITFINTQDNNIQYPIDNNSSNLLNSEDYPEYLISNNAIWDTKLLAGLKFILLNAPPFKSYTCFPAEYDNASRTAASIAIRQFMKDFNGNNDPINIFSKVIAEDKNKFPDEYFDYAEWLYFGAVDAYNKATPGESIFLSTDIEKEPHLSQGLYEAEVRITTNHPKGWSIDKTKLADGITIADDLKIVGDTYIGDSGSTLIKIQIQPSLMGEEIQIPVCYQDGETVVQCASPVNYELNYPEIISLTKQSTSIPAKTIILHIPKPAQLIITAVESDSEQPIKDAKVTIANEIMVKRVNTDDNGQIIVNSIPGKYTVSCSSPIDGYAYSGEESVNIAEGEQVYISLAFNKLQYKINVNTNDETTGEPLNGLTIKLKQIDGDYYKEKDSIDGVAVFDSLEKGKYIVQQQRNKKYKTSDEVEINLENRQEESISIAAKKISGQLKIGCRDEKDRYVEGVVFNLQKDEEIVDTITTVSEGPTEKTVPVGEYLLKQASVPDGIKEKTFEEKIKIEENKEKIVKVKEKTDSVLLNIYPRLQSDFEKFNPEKPKIKNNTISLKGCIFALIANEDIYDKNNNLVYSSGTLIHETDPTEGKYNTTSLRINYNGLYLLKQIYTAKGTLNADDIIIKVDKESQPTLDLPVLVPVNEDIEDNQNITEETVEIENESIYKSEDKPENDQPDTTQKKLIINVETPVMVSEEITSGIYNIPELKKNVEYEKTSQYKAALIDKKSGTVLIAENDSFIKPESGKYTLVVFPENNSLSPYIETIDYEDKTDEIDIKLNSKITTIILRENETNDNGENRLYGLYHEPIEGLSEETPKNKMPIAVTRSIFGYAVFKTNLEKGSYVLAPIKDNIDGSYDENKKTSFNIDVPGASKLIQQKDSMKHNVVISVVDSNTNSALPETYIQIIGSEDELYAYTDEYGEVNISLNPGSYNVKILLAPDTYSLPDVNTISFDLLNNGTINGKTVCKLGKNKLRFDVKDDNNSPIFGTSIELRNETATYIKTATSDPDGIVRFEGIPFGTYTVHERYPSAGYNTNKSDISIEIDGTYQNPNAPLATFVDSANEISCLVKDSEGKAIDGVPVVIRGRDGNVIQRAFTNGTGIATLRSIPIGKYCVNIESVPEQYLLSDKQIILTITGQKIITNINTEFTIKHKSIVCSLKDENGDPVSGAEFVLSNTEDLNNCQTSVTGDDGTLVFDSFEYGDYIIENTKAAQGKAVVEPVEIHIGKNWNDETKYEFVTYPNYYEMTVVNNRGVPVALVVFDIVNNKTKEKRSAISGNNGTVRFDNLREGNYTITQSEDSKENGFSPEAINLEINKNYKLPSAKYMFVLQNNYNK